MLRPCVTYSSKHYLSACYKYNLLPYDRILSVSDIAEQQMSIVSEGQNILTGKKDPSYGAHRLLAFNSYESHKSVEFNQYWKDNIIITLYIPPHSSHLLQPIDLVCFSPVEKACGYQAEFLMCIYINHVTKIGFLPYLMVAFDASSPLSNKLGDFWVDGLVPFNLEVVIKYLDNRPSTSVELKIEDGKWQSRTPSYTLELGTESKLIQERLLR